MYGNLKSHLRIDTGGKPLLIRMKAALLIILVNILLVEPYVLNPNSQDQKKNRSFIIDKISNSTTIEGPTIEDLISDELISMIALVIMLLYFAILYFLVATLLSYL